MDIFLKEVMLSIKPEKFFRTWIKRLARKTICFSKSEKMQDTVIGLLIYKVEFGINIYE